MARPIYQSQGTGVGNILDAPVLKNDIREDLPKSRIPSTVISTAGNVTYTTAQIVTSIGRNPNGGDRTDVLPSAADIIAAFGLATDGSESVALEIATVSAANTVAISGGTGNTYLGSATIGAAGVARFRFTPLTASTATISRHI